MGCATEANGRLPYGHSPLVLVDEESAWEYHLGPRLLGSRRFRDLGLRFRVLGPGFRVLGLGSRVSGVGLRASGFRAQG